MSPAQSKIKQALEAEIASLDAELTRVVALSTTTDSDRADLEERLRRLKRKARAL